MAGAHQPENRELNNFTYGYFKYDGGPGSVMCVFDTFYNERKTTVRTKCGKAEIKETFDSRDSAMRAICDTIGKNTITIKNISLMTHYYDDHFDK